MNKPTKQQWLGFIDEHKQSDLSITEFCRNKNISADNFYYHRSQLLKKESTNSSPFIQATVTKHVSSVNQSSFLTLNVGRSQLQLPPTTSPQWLAALMASLA
jgi:putative transposase